MLFSRLRTLVLITLHVRLLHCLVLIPICHESILHKYLAFLISTVKGKECNEAEYLSKYLPINDQESFL